MGCLIQPRFIKAHEAAFTAYFPGLHQYLQLITFIGQTVEVPQVTDDIEGLYVHLIVFTLTPARHPQKGLFTSAGTVWDPPDLLHFNVRSSSLE